MARRRQKERIESLKEGKEEERKGQVLNTERERERERERVTCVRKIVSARLQLCGRVGEMKFQTFQFFYCVQVSSGCVEMKVRIFYLLFVEVIVKIPMCLF